MNIETKLLPKLLKLLYLLNKAWKQNYFLFIDDIIDIIGLNYTELNEI